MERRGMALAFGSWSLVLFLLFLTAVRAQDAGRPPLSYKIGDPIPVTCLNRSSETGDHVELSPGKLQWIPFPTCNETGKPFQLEYDVEEDVNCTLDFISDPFFHLLEFYIHNDVPLTCRIPSRPLSIAPGLFPQTTLNSEASKTYIPLTFVLSGVFQLSHLHVAHNLNILLHTTPETVAKGVIDAATAYSVSHLSKTTRVVIGDALPLRFSVRWFPSSSLPAAKEWTGVGGHLTFSTLLYCLLSAGGSAAICIAYFRGVDLPRRLKTYGRERAFSVPVARAGYGYNVGMSNGYAYQGQGKID